VARWKIQMLRPKTVGQTKIVMSKSPTSFLDYEQAISLASARKCEALLKEERPGLIQPDEWTYLMARCRLRISQRYLERLARSPRDSSIHVTARGLMRDTI